MSAEKQRAREGMDFGIRVGAVMEREDALLLVRHQKPQRDPYWVLPGGRLEPGETIPECAEREILEETGLESQFAGVLYVSEFLTEGRHTIDITVRVTPSGEAEPELGSDPELAPGSEPTLREVRLVAFDELREIALLPPAVKWRLLEEANGGTYLGASRD